MVAADDPLDTYLVHHPEALFDRPVEAAVLDPQNPYVLAPHLAAAAAELPFTDADVDFFGPTMPALVEVLCARGLLRRRPGGWYWTHADRAPTTSRCAAPGGGAHRRAPDRQGARHRRRDGGPRQRPHRCRLRPPGADLCRHRAGPGRCPRPGDAR